LSVDIYPKRKLVNGVSFDLVLPKEEEVEVTVYVYIVMFSSNNRNKRQPCINYIDVFHIT